MPGVLESLAARAPAGATLVVTTPGVLPHIPRAGRERLFATLAALDAVWISIDPPGLHERGSRPSIPATWGGFVLGRDGVAARGRRPARRVPWSGAPDRRSAAALA